MKLVKPLSSKELSKVSLISSCAGDRFLNCNNERILGSLSEQSGDPVPAGLRD